MIELIKKDESLLIAGGTGMVGSALIRSFLKHGYSNIHATWHSKNPSNMDQTLFYSADPKYSNNNHFSNNIVWHQCNLIDQKSVSELYEKTMPKGVLITAALVGGIQANNTYRGQFIYENLQNATNLIHYAHLYKVS